MRQKNKTSWSLGLWHILIAVILVILIYYRVFFQGYWAINSSDATHLHLPNNYFLTNLIREWQFPFWNPNFNLGQPVVDGSSTMFHPFLPFFLLFNPLLANTIEILIGLCLTLLGAWFFLREQNFEIFPSFIGALIYTFSGPVFFLHSYHLGFMAILLLPWCLFALHKYDKHQRSKWLWSISGLCVLAVQSLDFDTLLYLYLGLIIDRIVSLPEIKRKNYLINWSTIFFITFMTGLANYFPLYEWIKNSSRLVRSYSGVLFPDLPNLLSAVFTGQWLNKWVYDVFYFYFGPAAIWLCIAGLLKINKNKYCFHYFICSISIVFIYFLTQFIQQFNPNFLNFIDIWKGMFIFCLGFAMVSSCGVNVLLNQERYSQLVTNLFFVGTLFLTVWAIRHGYPVRICSILLIAAFGMLLTKNYNIKYSRIISYLGISVAVLSTLLFSAIYHVNGNYLCVRYNTEITEELPFYKNLYQDSDGNTGHWRISVFPGTFNPTSLVSLKTIPNYTPIYNKNLEKSLITDNLIVEENTHPYWMNLKSTNAKALSLYGVKFIVISKKDLTVRAPWDLVSAEWDGMGWIKREDLSWPNHEVWENSFYIGRAYLVSANIDKQQELKFLKDTPTSVILEVRVQDDVRLVLADLYYPGWQAYIEGKPVSTEAYHGCLRSVNLSKGTHTVKWEYSGKVQRVGLILSGIVSFCLIVFLFFNRDRK